MSGNNLVADTNAFLYLLNGNNCIKPYLSKNLHYSIITEMELLSFCKLSEQEENNIKQLLSNCAQELITEKIKNETIRLRKKYQIKLPDAIIAATAIVNNLPLLTADKGFCKILDLNLILLEP